MAKDAEDVQVIAVMLQDAIVPLCDMLYTPEEKSFIMIAQRFRWDDIKNPEPDGSGCFERINCAVEINGVEGVKKHGFGNFLPCSMLELLTIMLEEGTLRMVFAGGVELKLAIGPSWKLGMRDFGVPWPGAKKPIHPA